MTNRFKKKQYIYYKQNKLPTNKFIYKQDALLLPIKFPLNLKKITVLFFIFV